MIVPSPVKLLPASRSAESLSRSPTEPDVSLGVVTIVGDAWTKKHSLSLLVWLAAM